jgi:hypothetical protein
MLAWSRALINHGTVRHAPRVQPAMSVRRIAVLLAASAALALSGCAGNSAGGSPGAPASAAPPSSAAPSADAPGETLSGTVAAGVEPNCLILQGGGTHHVLIFDDPSLRSVAKVGSSITVTGRAEPGQMTTCQQGVPFIVTAVRAN